MIVGFDITDWILKATRQDNMKNVRIGIIGLGNMGKFHADYLIIRKSTAAN